MKLNSIRIMAGLVMVGLLSTGFFALQDDEVLTWLSLQWKKRNQSMPEEALYIQTDKVLYQPGEVIWLNAFLLDRDDHTPSDISDVVYAKLYNPRGQVVDSIDLVVHEGTAPGVFNLGRTAPGGRYKIKAYTKWMQNFGREVIFSKDLTVLKVETPRLLMTMDWEREAYGPGDTVVAELSIKDLTNLPAAQAMVFSNWILNGRTVRQDTAFTDAEGELRARFVLPKSLDHNQGTLSMVVSYQGETENISRRIPIMLNRLHLTWQPEGGQAVYGLPARFGFRATNDFGQGADCSGHIISTAGDTVASFSSLHQGIGKVEFTPQPGQQYWAQLAKPVQQRVALPLPDSAGWVLRYQNQQGGRVRGQVYASQPDTAYLAVHQFGKLVHSQRLLLKTGSNDFALDQSKLDAGAAVLVLFDTKKDARAERIVFIQNRNNLFIEVRPEKEYLRPRETQTLNISVTDSLGAPVSAKLSLAVVDDQVHTFIDDKQDNLLTHMLLSGEVQGTIEDPAYYLDPEENDAPEALDNLLLLQRWRGVAYQQLHQDTWSIQHVAEKVTTLSGRLLTMEYKPVQGQVYLIEQGGKQRILPVNTTYNGYFTYKNLDPTVPLILATRKPYLIGILNDGELRVATGTSSRRDPYDRGLAQISTTIPDPPSQALADSMEPPITSNGMSLSEDISALSEVVVVGYSGYTRSNLTSSVSYVDYYGQIIPGQALEEVLAGKVSGLTIATNSDQVAIRGMSSMYGARTPSGPMVIVDGVMLDEAQSINFNNGSLLDPFDIKSITVLGADNASPLYGMSGQNGVIVVTTYEGLVSRPLFNFQPRYNTMVHYPRRYHTPPSFPKLHLSPNIDSQSGAYRKDLRTTLYWNPEIKTGADGKATLSFQVNDKQTSFRVVTEGLSSSGDLARHETTFNVGLPLSLDYKYPQYLSTEDVLEAPARIRNTTKDTLEAWLLVKVDTHRIEYLGELEQKVTIPPKSVVSVPLTLRSKRNVPWWYARKSLDLYVTAGLYRDELSITLPFKSVGIPVYNSYVSQQQDTTFQVPVVDPTRKSLRASLDTNPDLLSQIVRAAEQALRRPYGCFEQSTSRTIMNAITLDWIGDTELDGWDRFKTKRYLVEGLDKLKAYQSDQGGFGWFPKHKPRLGISAYGLMALNQLQESQDVSPVMIHEVKSYLNRQRGPGGVYWEYNYAIGKDSAATPLSQAYVTYALTESGETGLELEYKVARQQLDSSWSWYRAALLAQAAWNLGQTSQYESLVNKFIEEYPYQDLQTYRDRTISGSWGYSYRTETISHWMMALMKENRHDDYLPVLEQAILELNRNHVMGYYWSSQGTAMALMAMSKYFKRVGYERAGGMLEIIVNQQLYRSVEIEAGAGVRKTYRGVDSLMNAGDNTVRVHLEGMQGNLMQQILNVNYYTLSPPSDPNCRVALTTKWSHETVKTNQLVQLKATIANQTVEDLPMVVARLALPAGVQMTPTELEYLEETKVADFIEVNDGEIVLYYTDMRPSERKEVNINLVAFVPGKFRSPPSSAYLYYTEESKSWVMGARLTVEE